MIAHETMDMPINTRSRKSTENPAPMMSEINEDCVDISVVAACAFITIEVRGNLQIIQWIPSLTEPSGPSFVPSIRGDFRQPIVWFFLYFPQGLLTQLYFVFLPLE